MKFRIWDKQELIYVDKDKAFIGADDRILIYNGKEFVTPADPDRFVVKTDGKVNSDNQTVYEVIRDIGYSIMSMGHDKIMAISVTKRL